MIKIITIKRETEEEKIKVLFGKLDDDLISKNYIFDEQWKTVTIDILKLIGQFHDNRSL